MSSLSLLQNIFLGLMGKNTCWCTTLDKQESIDDNFGLNNRHLIIVVLTVFMTDKR